MSKNNKALLALLLIGMIIVVYQITMSGTIDALPSKLPQENVTFKISIDGQLVKFDDNMGYAWINGNSRTMVPLRLILEQVGYEVDWEPSTKTALINHGDLSLKLEIGKSEALRNGVSIPIDVQDGKIVNTKAVLYNNRTYVPIRFVIESMGGRIEDYKREQVGKKVTHHITITTGKIIPPVATDPTFNPQTDVLPDGRLTKEKTTEYIEKMIDGTTLKKVNGKYILEFERPAIAEGYSTVLALNILTNSGVGNYALNTAYALLPENKLPGDQSFTYELDANRLSDVNFYKFTLGVYKSGVGSSTSYEIWYYPGKNSAHYIYTNEWGAVEKWDIPFDKNRLFEGL